MAMTWIVPGAIAAQEHFEKYPHEEHFVKYLGEVFQVTYAGRWNGSKSEYSYYYLRAYFKPAQRYGLSGEILALYAPYTEVQARSLIDAAEIQQRNKERLHPVWNILITDDPSTVEHLADLTAGKDLEVYSIPFSRAELEAKPGAEFILSRVEQFVHGRDLFAFQSALQSDAFFFGRKHLVDDITGQVENGQNFGLFGLRKIGKTSVLLAVERYLSKLETYKTVHIDCQSPSVYLMRWNALLARICSELSGHEQALLGHADQVRLFEKLVNSSSQTILLIFDEIENISLGGLSPSKHWEEDFLPFWGAIRAAHQESHGKLSFGVAGVNPHLFDVALVAGKDNPVLLGVSPLYLAPLDEQSVRDMVRTIGRYMGLSFEESVYGWLFSQFGGHPFLVRKACSLVCRKTGKKSGEEIHLTDFTSRQQWLDEQLGRDILNILVVLAQHYPDEFDNLVLLAQGEQQWIQQLKEADPETLRHILEYGIVSECEGQYCFTIDVLRRFVSTQGEPMKKAVRILADSSDPTDYTQLPAPGQLELWGRLGRARNLVEPRLRALLHRALLFKYGEKKALQQVLDKFSSEKQKSLAGYSLAQIFTGESKALYLRDIKEIGLREWELIKHVFGNDRKGFEARMDLLNSEGRADAHANPIEEELVVQIEAVAHELVDQMAPFLS
jgi:hypothetical protein